MTKTCHSEFFSGVIFNLDWLRRVSRKGDTIKGFMKTQREIKFRAWNKNLGKMITDIGLFSDNEPDEYFNEDDCILMQYTGLKDKNGVEIYEGDVLKVSLEDAGVQYLNTLGEAIIRQGFVILEVDDIFFFYTTPCGDDFEVIGNVFENPELLK
jgi:hypothetical protein